MPRARLSAALAALFPAGAVRGAQLHYRDGAGMAGAVPMAGAAAAGAARAVLTPAEWQAIQHCRQARVRDFAAGRMCAHRALRELGVTGFSLLPAPDRRPLWPHGIVGSITHTQGYSAAVVARADAVAALGIDTELVSAVHQRLWPLICTAQELQWLWRLSAQQRSRAAGLIFAAKEAYFKCQYPLVGEALGFDAVQLEPLRLSPQGRFHLSLLKGRLPSRLAPSHAHPVRLAGHYRLHRAFITAALALPAAALAHRAARGARARPIQRQRH